VSGFSPDAGLKNGQFNRKRNEGVKNPKFQAPNFKQITMTEIQNPKKLVFDLIWDLLFVFLRDIQVRV
jgi:hypothetical protein